MTLEFSDKDQEILVHHFDECGVYITSNKMLIEANTGLPALASNVDLPALASNEVAVFDGQKWHAKIDLRGKIAYAKSGVQADSYNITSLGDLPDTHTLIKPQDFDKWVNNGWQYDIERERPIKAVEERNWRDGELAKVLSRIDQYEKDKNYPVELRTSPIKAEADFLLLLNDRKVLSDYPNTPDFPFCGQPSLSGLAR